MALALSLEKLDGLDPAVAALYVEKDGKFVLDVDGLEDTSGLKSALEAERKARKDFEKKYGALKDVDPEEYARLKKEAEDRETNKLKEAGEFEKLREKWQKDKDALEADYKAKVAEKDALLQKHVLDSQVRNAALEAGILPDRLIRVMRDTAHLFKLDDEGNIRVLDENGETTPKSLQEFFSKDYKAEAPYFYAASGASGGGTPPGGTPPGGPKTELQKLEEQYDAAVKAKDTVKRVALKRKIHELRQAGG